MQNLILLAHPTKGSFCHSITERVQQTLQELDVDTNIRDLYAMKFDPVMTDEDIEKSKQNDLPAEIKTEQKLILDADFITLIYPVWWGGMPAILKGYIDRVFTYGFAFTSGERGPIGLLKEKKILSFVTHGAPKEVYEKQGMYSAMNTISNKAVVEFSGMKSLINKYYSSISQVDESTKEIFLEDVESTIKRYLT
jgi:NAD(P)H dehydrogenase (quinone)